jgi:hypothetical protein
MGVDHQCLTETHSFIRRVNTYFDYFVEFLKLCITVLVGLYVENERYPGPGM